MNYKTLFKLLFILLIMQVLLSCGTISNGMFEKRKHTKGWHFKMKKNIPFGVAERTAKDRYNKENANKSLDLSIREDEEFLTSNLKIESDFLRSDTINTVEHEMAIHTSSKVGERRASVKDGDQYFKVLKSNKSNSSNKSKAFDFPFQENHNFNKDVFNSIDDHEQVQNYKRNDEPILPHVLTPLEILVGALILYLIAIAAFGILAFGIVLLAYSSIFISLGFGIIGSYFLFVFFVYRILKLFRREGSDYVWSLKKTFLIVGLIYFSILALFFTALFVGY